ncbi:MAG: VOC family protein [Verrucomicrobia bacterium]|nr:VOC family protein [Verrucomicrobiota bacterium]
MRIRLASVMVADQERALRFYTGVLGFVTMQDYPNGVHRWLTVAAPEVPDGPQLLLEPIAFPPARAYQSALFDAGIPHAAFAVADVTAEYDRLRNRGVTFQGAPSVAGVIRVAVLNDTCGNWIQLFERK